MDIQRPVPQPQTAPVRPSTDSTARNPVVVPNATAGTTSKPIDTVTQTPQAETPVLSEVSLFDFPYAQATPQLHDATEFYTMSGDFLGSVNTAGKSTRYAVDGDAFAAYLKAHPIADPDNSASAATFVQGVTTELAKQEKASGKDLIAKETTLQLQFVGDAEDVAKWGVVRQVGDGTLNVMANFDDGKSFQVASFSATSGPMRNGLLPNGHYTAFAPQQATGSFPDETGKFGFKMVLAPQFKMARSDLRIHSTFDPRVVHGLGMTEGCIGLNGGDLENVGFFTGMSAYFKSHKSIEVSVAIDGNANVTTQLGDKQHY